MVVAGLLLYAYRVDETSGLQNIAYLIYGLGIVWALTDYVRWQAPAAKFGALFNQGFKCFVVVALVMTVFTLVFYKVNSQIVEERAVLTKQELLKSEKNRTPQEIDAMVENGKKNFAVVAASIAIFQYLFIGVVVTLATSGALYLRNKK